MEQRYRQLAKSEGDATDAKSKLNIDTIGKKREVTRKEHISQTIHSLVWLGVAVAILYFGDVWRVMKEDPRLNRSFLIAAWACQGVLATVVFYITFWIPFVDRKKVYAYDRYCPRAIYTAIAAAFASFVLFTIAFWPVWHFLTPVLVFCVGMAAILSANFLPSW
jgi:hypothetical protein